jgi:hypothetical protein
LLACNTNSQPAQTTTGGAGAANTPVNSTTAVNNSSNATVGGGLGSTQAGTPDQAKAVSVANAGSTAATPPPASTTTPPPATTTTTTTSQGNATIQNKYAGYVRAQSAALTDPTPAAYYAITNNLRSAAIVTINGVAPIVDPSSKVKVIPPQNSGYFGKNDSDLSPDFQSYTVTVTTDDGRTGTNTFNTSDATLQGWGIGVSDDGNGGIKVAQNAGGSGGSGGGDDGPQGPGFGNGDPSK